MGKVLDGEGLGVAFGLMKEWTNEQLSNKASVFYVDRASGNTWVFASEEDKEAYLADQSKTELLLGVIEGGTGGGGGGGGAVLEGAILTMITPLYKAVKLGSKGNNINFSADILNNRGQSTGERIEASIIITHNATTQTQTLNIRAGQIVSFSVDKYLREGENTISIRITGKSSGSSTMVAVTYDVIDLTLEDSYDSAQYVDMADGEAVLTIPYALSGYGIKKMEWYIDGVALPYVSEEDEIVDSSTERTKYINLSQLNQGKHTLQFRASTSVNGEIFYTDTLYHDLLVFTGDRSQSLVGVSMIIPSEYGIVEGNSLPTLYGIEQFVPYTFKFFTYSPKGLALGATVKVDNQTIGSVDTQNGVLCNVIYTPMSSGEKTLVIELSDGTSYTFGIVVSSTAMSLGEIKDALDLDFNGDGKSNLSTDKNVWTYGDYVGTFEGFEWTERSGWKNNRLVISNGCKLTLSAMPLDKAAATNGKTIELEFMSTNVNDDNAVLMDLRDDSGTGILVTATKVTITSKTGVAVETEYKENEMIRIGFVINKSENATRKGLTLIYCNGIASRCNNRAASDGYEVNKPLVFQGSEGATMELKSVRIYNTALSDEQMLNNYTLYRDTLAEMMEVYERNDIYEEGSYTISVDKSGRRLPYMLITGDIPVLENTTDKNEQIVVEIEYVNSQNPSLNFTMESAAMRPQGTSSMGYPKKNFRIYTQELPQTVLKDYQGNVVEDKLYAFRQGSQPVNCWCLKADYAESSGTHNTAVARMWGNALKNVSIEVNGKKEYVCQTTAQKAAAANNYPYDVRTTIDGFPILLFYRRNKQDSPIFIGKYNFNNDKSTESVFGFTGIPGFDNSRMQCWEILNNDNALSLFIEYDSFDAKWQEAFESRYPDTKTPNTADLKAFCQWMTQVTQEDFTTQKHQHMNLWMMAAYYCYLMRHAGADQFVKNAMLTSEDGEKFYFILYDNDTINGLINTGHLKIKPTDDRNSIGEDGEHLFAGHNSRLWNMLEADDEFMNMVSQIDNALYTAGISYRNAINEFDGEQADKWCERIYNQDAQYKYIGPYTNDDVNNLFMMQGSRSLHRRWFLAKRFGIYDAKFVSGTYKSQSIEVKCINNTPGQQFSITAGYPLHYGYGINNVPREYGIYLERGEKYTFTTDGLSLGDPLRIYAAHNLEEIDFSSMMDRMAVINLAGIYDADLGTRLKKLYIGNPVKENVTVTGISGLNNAEKLEYIDVRNMKALNKLTLTSSPLIKYVDTRGSGVSSIEFAEGATLETLQISSAMSALTLERMYSLSTLTSENNFMTVASMKIIDCPHLTHNFQMIHNWITNTQLDASQMSLEMTGVLWTEVAPEALIALGSIGSLKLKGRIYLTSATEEQVDTLSEMFGPTCFEKGADLQISAPDGLFIGGGSEVVSSESIELSVAIFSENPGKVEWSITSGSYYASIQSSSGTTCLITTKEVSSDNSFTVQVKHIPTEGDITYATKVITLKKVTRVTGGGVNGPSTIGSSGEYTFKPSPSVYDRPYTVTWSLTGTAATSGYVRIKRQSNDMCEVEVVEKVSDSTFNVVATVNNGLTSFTRSTSVKIGVRFVLNILSNQPTDAATIEAVQATVYYGVSNTKMKNGDELSVASGTTIKVQFPNVANYKAPSNMEFVIGSEDSVKSGTYLAERVEVTLSAEDGKDLSGTVVTINRVQYTFQGDSISVIIAYDASYDISFGMAEGYSAPYNMSYTASQATRVIPAIYEKMPAGVIMINSNIQDPATMISGAVNSSVIQAIRAESHRYLGKYTAEGQMTLCQLDDSDSNKYADGTAAVLTGDEGDVFMKMPTFWYRSLYAGANAWALQFHKDQTPPEGNDWIQWDTNALIGVYEASEHYYSSIGYKFRSRSYYSPVKERFANAIAKSNRGVGFQLIDWQMHCVMALLFYAQYGHTNSQEKIGAGTNSQQKTSGQTNSCGMQDTKGTSPVSGLNDAGVDGNTQSINFWGLENWWGDVKEWIGNAICYHNRFEITEPDGTVRNVNAYTEDYDYVSIMDFKGCDLVATTYGSFSGSSTTGFCDQADYYVRNEGYSNNLRRSGDMNGTNGGVSYLENDSTDPSYATASGSRLAFRGQCIEAESVEAFKSLTAIG